MDIDSIEWRKDFLLLLLYTDRVQKLKREKSMTANEFALLTAIHLDWKDPKIDIAVFMDTLYLDGYITFPGDGNAPHLTDDGSRFILKGGFSKVAHTENEILQIVAKNIIIIGGDNNGNITQH
jgi:hypothetical protein